MALPHLLSSQAAIAPAVPPEPGAGARAERFAARSQHPDGWLRLVAAASAIAAAAAVTTVGYAPVMSVHFAAPAAGSRTAAGGIPQQPSAALASRAAFAPPARS